MKGAAWARLSRSLTVTKLLTAGFLKNLHKRMFGDVWKWAGTHRLTGRNIGIEAYRIPEELAAMLGDVRDWGEHKTFPPDEIAIHPFPNGNGRHARLIAGLLIERLGSQPFSWGGGSLADAGELRAKYIAALQAADNHNIEPLLAFARL